MLSFLKNRPNDEDEEQETSGAPGGKPPARFMSWQDALVLLVIAGIIFGVYTYFKSSKNSSTELFEKCEAFYTAEDWDAMEGCYEQTWELGYITDELDSIRQARLGVVKDLRSAQEDLLEVILDAMDKGDTALARQEIEKMTPPILLFGERKDDWDRINTIKKP
ncbi:MAG: hypothetical protein LBR60_09320 [Fibrobacter sp.]|jgi:hypothetical protein|nr:hypothetical protein [Fibrobacter sp.]